MGLITLTPLHSSPRNPVLPPSCAARHPSTPNMLLTQKPQPINFRRHHRRHPASLSTIAVAQHPTPGLLSLSKPQRQPSRHPQRPQSPRFPPRSRLHRPASVSIPDLQSTTLFTPDPPRGRSHQNNAPTHQHRRSASQVHLPDVTVTSGPDAALPFPTQQHVSSDPPTLAAQPSGRLARSRRARNKSTPAAAVPPNFSPERTRAAPAPSPAKLPSAPIPVPKGRRAASPAHKVLSRSDPLSKLTIHISPLVTPSKRKDRRHRNKAKRAPDGGALPLADWDFPAPGSSDDDAEDADDDEEPVTPIGQTGANDKAWQRALNDGPRTAPLQPRGAQFPFFQFPARTSPARTKTPALVTPSKLGRQDHRRAPSHPISLGLGSAALESMFHLSEDEGEALPASADVREKMALLFGTGAGNGTASPLFPHTGIPGLSPRKSRAARERDRYVRLAS